MSYAYSCPGIYKTIRTRAVFSNWRGGTQAIAQACFLRLSGSFSHHHKPNKCSLSGEASDSSVWTCCYLHVAHMDVCSGESCRQCPCGGNGIINAATRPFQLSYGAVKTCLQSRILHPWLVSLRHLYRVTHSRFALTKPVICHFAPCGHS